MSNKDNKENMNPNYDEQPFIFTSFNMGMEKNGMKNKSKTNKTT